MSKLNLRFRDLKISFTDKFYFKGGDGYCKYDTVFDCILQEQRTLIWRALQRIGFFSAIPRIVFECYSTYCFFCAIPRIVFECYFMYCFLIYLIFFRLGKFFNIKKSTQQRFEEQFSELLKNCFYYK